MKVAIAAILILLVALVAASPAAQPGDAVQDHGELRFRRVYIPEDAKDWPRGNFALGPDTRHAVPLEKYLPIEAGEFERLLAAIGSREQGAGSKASGVGLPAPWLVQAQYEGRLKGQTLLQGSATLDVSPAIAGSTLMSLDPCAALGQRLKLAIDRAQWVTSDGAPVALGMSSDGRLQVLAERGGQMKFDWSLAGQEDAAGGVVFDVALPPSPVSCLRIELPAESAPTVDRGVLSDEGPVEKVESQMSKVEGPRFRHSSFDFSHSPHRWRIELGGWAGCRLRIGKKGSDEARRQVVLANRSTVYNLSLRGVDVAVQLNIASGAPDAHREPLRKVTLDLEPSLELLEVAAGDQPLSWTAVSEEKVESQMSNVEGLWFRHSSFDLRHSPLRRFDVELSSPQQNGAVQLRFRAVAPLSMPDAWKLPRIFIDGVVCRTDTVRLAVSSPLCIAGLTPHGCRQTAVTALKSAAGEQLDFEAFDPEAGLELSLCQRPTEVQAVSATATVLGQGKMSSRVATDFSTAEGPVFALEADVLRRWTIDAVESQPADALDDWTLENRDGGTKLSIRLAHPLTSVRPLRLIVSARRLYAVPGRNLEIDDVVPLRFAAPVTSRRLVDIRASGPNELRVAAGGTRSTKYPPWRVDVKELTAADLDLFAEPPGDLLLHDDAATRTRDPRAGTPVPAGYPAALRFSVEARKPTYAAVIGVEAILGGGMLEENYTLVCTPVKSAPVDHLVVHFAGRRGDPLHWSVAGADESRFTARRWTTAQESAAGLSADEEAWDIAFRNPQSARIEVHAMRKTKISGPLPLCLASLPDAASQQATLTVRSLGRQAVQIRTHRLTPLPAETVPAGQIQTVRASFQYDPRSETTPQAEPAIVLTTIDSESPAAWVWDCDIHSQYAADGAGEHTVTYLIQTAGSRQIDLKLPAPLVRRDLHGVWINDKPTTAFTVVSADHDHEYMVPDMVPAEVVTIDLPVDARFVRLAIRLSTRGAPLATFHRLQPPLPDIGVPVFARHWSVELPPGYATLSEEQGAGSWELGVQGRLQAPGRVPSGWLPAGFGLRNRLLGCLGRSDEQRVFNPFRGNDWRSLFQEQGTRPQAPCSYRMDLTDGTIGVTVIHRPTIDAAGWLLFFAVAGLGAWRRTGRPVLLLVLAGVCGICALLFPAAIAMVFSRGLLAVMFCLLLRLVKRRTSPPGTQPAQRPREVPSTLTNIVPFGAPLLAAVMLCSAGATSAAATPAYSVFIPVNDKQEPTGGKYFVSETFFSELYRRAALHAEKPQGWLITSAVYRTALAEDASLQGHVVDRLTAEYEIRVFNTGARVCIPLRREDVSLVPGQAQLDERPVQPDWDADGRTLLLDIAEPGEYRLELTLRPNVRPENRSAGFEMAIPRVPTARLEFSVPTGGPSVEVPSALGEVRWEEMPSRWVAELGPSDRLAVAWQDTATRTRERVPAGYPAAGGPVNVEQFQWLKIEPGCVLLHVRLKARSTGPLRRLLVKADAGLELLPETRPAARLVPAGTDDATQAYEFQLPQSTGAETTLDLHFLCPGGSGIGTFHAPKIEVPGARMGRHWLAVSVDPSLEYQLAGARVQETGAVAEFVASWGTGDPQADHDHEYMVPDMVPAPAPDLAFRLNGNAVDWGLTTHARKIETSGDQNVSWSFDAEHANVQFDAQLLTSGGSRFQYRFEAPAVLHIDSLTVASEGTTLPARWAQDGDGRVTLFLGDAVTGRHQLQIRGQLPLPMNRKVAMPQLRLEEVRIQNSVVRLYRRPAVLVEVSAAPGLADVQSSAEDVGRAALGQLLRSFYVDPAEASSVSVTLRPNRVQANQEIVAESQEASPQPPPVGGTRIARADVRFAWQADGRRLGAAIFDVQSPATADYSLELPDGFSLLHLTIDGVPVDAMPAQGRTWIVPLSSQALKSRVEMLFFADPRHPVLRVAGSGPLASAGRMVVQAPRLGDLPVESIVWTIAAPRGLHVELAGVDGARIAPAEPAEENVTDLVAQWRQLTEKSGSVVSCAIDGPADSIAVNFAAATSQAWPARLAEAAGFLAIMVLLALLLRRGLIGNWFVHWPYLFGVGLGIAWWLWAWPSALGLVIVLAVLLRQIIAGRRLMPVVMYHAAKP